MSQIQADSPFYHVCATRSTLFCRFHDLRRTHIVASFEIVYELQAWTDQIAQEVQRKIGTSLIRVLGGRGDWEDDLGLLACFSRRSFKLD